MIFRVYVNLLEGIYCISVSVKQASQPRYTLHLHQVANYITKPQAKHRFLRPFTPGESSKAPVKSQVCRRYVTPSIARWTHRVSTVGLFGESENGGGIPHFSRGHVHGNNNKKNDPSMFIVKPIVRYIAFVWKLGNYSKMSWFVIMFLPKKSPILGLNPPISDQPMVSYSTRGLWGSELVAVNLPAAIPVVLVEAALDWIDLQDRWICGWWTTGNLREKVGLHGLTWFTWCLDMFRWCCMGVTWISLQQPEVTVGGSFLMFPRIPAGQLWSKLQCANYGSPGRLSIHSCFTHKKWDLNG